MEYYWKDGDNSSNLLKEYKLYIQDKPECIPVGCVLPSAVAICWGGLPQCKLGYPPPRCGPGDPLSDPGGLSGPWPP